MFYGGCERDDGLVGGRAPGSLKSVFFALFE